MTLVLPIPTYARLPGQALQTTHDSPVLFPWSDSKDTTPDSTIRIHPGGSIVTDGANENIPSSMSTLKRKLDFEEPVEEPRPKRISPYLNTPKQRKEERRKVLRISVQKLRQIDDPECFLRRSVLINNTLKKMQREIREEKLRGPFGWNLYNDNSVLPRRRTHQDLTVLNNRYLASSAHLYDDFFVHPEHEKIDKITDCGPDVSAILEHSVVGYETTNSMCSSSSTSESTSPRDANTQTTTDGLTNNDRQIVSEMDAVFNNIISVFSDLGDEVLRK